MSVLDREVILSAAHDYRARGWRVIPLVPGDKMPVEKGWQNTPPLSGADVQAMFEEQPYNLGIATGAPSGFWVLDIDLDKPGTADRLRALQNGRRMPATRLVKTPGGGYHYYFAMPDFGVTNSARNLPDGVDVRGTGGQVVAPPSVTVKGTYELVVDAEIVRAPEWLEELVRPLPPAAPVDLETLPKLTDLTPRERKRLDSYADRIIEAEVNRLKECSRLGWNGPAWNQTTFEVACTLIELANSPWCFLSLVGARGFVAEFAPRDKDFDDREVESIFSSALKKVAGKARALPEDRKDPGTVYEGDPLSDPNAATPQRDAGAGPPSQTFAWNDLGNAHRMVALYGDRLRWIKQAGDWAVYTDGAWKIDEGEGGHSFVQELVESMYEREAHNYSDTRDDEDKPSPREAFEKWCRGQQMSPRIAACLKETKGRRELQARITDFDADPFLFNCANGVVDLRTGELQKHDPSMLMMLQSPVEYHANAATSAGRWMAFLERCLPDPAVRRYLQKVFGYSITGSMAEQAMFIHHGRGANGKSVFLQVATHVTGGYGQTVPRETLLAKGSGGSEHPTSIARMRGKRFLQASETAAGRRLDEETVKGLTGGEQQPARFMSKDFFDFTPTGKIHFVTNHLPRLTDADSIWRRLHLVGWSQVIPKGEQDQELAEKIIREEAEGVLAWAVQGAMTWHLERLSVPESMKADLADYRQDQDVLGEFIDARIEVDPMAFTASSDIYGAYQAWCFNSGIKNPLTAHDLARALRERGFDQHRTKRERGFRVNLLAVPQTLPSAAYDPLTVS
jgi:P4 family phage/plasmid primase-like protien